MKDTPRQCKLLGARVRGLGVVVAVTTSLRYGFAIVEDADGCARNLYFRDIKSLDGFTLAPTVPEFVTYTARTGYGVWTEIHEAVSVPAAPALELAA